MRPYGFLQGCSDEYYYWKHRIGWAWSDLRYRYSRKYREKVRADRKVWQHAIEKVIRNNAGKISENIQANNALLSKLKGE